MPWEAMMAGVISTQWNAGTHRPDSGTTWPVCQHHGAPWVSRHLMESKFLYQTQRPSPLVSALKRATLCFEAKYIVVFLKYYFEVSWSLRSRSPASVKPQQPKKKRKKEVLAHDFERIRSALFDILFLFTCSKVEYSSVKMAMTKCCCISVHVLAYRLSQSHLTHRYEFKHENHVCFYFNLMIGHLLFSCGKK